GAADFGGGGHLRIERLGLARPALEKKENHRAGLEHRATSLTPSPPPRRRGGHIRRGARLCLQQSHEREPAQREAADFEERTAIEPVVAVEYGEHEIPPEQRCVKKAGCKCLYHSISGNASEKREHCYA